ncbi:MAG: FHA domain-containing serine/threonine-protein kinase [Lachnospiraceae bacterium]|nr:FHA domain-containing serine/threonine-protein kinase [Lachnospiraceae bacterium]
MNLQQLCTNCFSGRLESGICTYCHKSAKASASERLVNTLPDRYMLASHYYIGKVIGKGGFGITYLAWDYKWNQRVVVKELYPDLDVERNIVTNRIVPKSGQEDYFAKCRQHFKEEAQILYGFRREPSIVNVYGLAEENNTVYYSMECLSGFDMRSMIRRQRRIPWSQLSSYIREILRTLHIIHGRGLIHRDISPDNIFLTSLTEAKLIDFGSVRCYNSGNGMTTILKHVFAPMEQYYTNGKQGPWTDVYALSVTMYYALSGKMPPKAPSRLMQNEKVVPVENFCPELPAHVSRSIRKGMELEPKDRFQSALEMAAALFPGEDILVKQGSSDRNVSGLRAPVLSGTAAGQKCEAGDRKLAEQKSQPGTWKLAGQFAKMMNYFGMEKRAGKARVTATIPRDGCRLRGIAGLYQGQVFILAAENGILIGRSEECRLRYPAGAESISRTQCRLWCDRNLALYIMDHSTNGTLVSGQRLQRDRWYRLRQGNTIHFSGESFYVE